MKLLPNSTVASVASYLFLIALACSCNQPASRHSANNTNAYPRLSADWSICTTQYGTASITGLASDQSKIKVPAAMFVATFADIQLVCVNDNQKLSLESGDAVLIIADEPPRYTDTTKIGVTVQRISSITDSMAILATLPHYLRLRSASSHDHDNFLQLTQILDSYGSLEGQVSMDGGKWMNIRVSESREKP